MELFKSKLHFGEDSQVFNVDKATIYMLNTAHEFPAGGLMGWIQATLLLTMPLLYLCREKTSTYTHENKVEDNSGIIQQICRKK